MGWQWGCSRIPSRAEDVTQDAFIAAWRNRAKFDAGRGLLLSWLLAATRNSAIDLMRGCRGRQWFEGEIPETRSPIDVEEAMIRGLEARALTVAVAALPDEQRYAIEQAYFHGRSGPEIAEDIGVPLSTIKGRMRLGLQKLAHDLELLGAEVSGQSAPGLRRRAS